MNQVERYSDWQLVGRGGSADVYRVWDRELDIAMAVKVLRSQKADQPGQQRAMRNEVRVSRALRHSAICPIHDIYDGERGFGIVMDYLEGSDLRVWQKANAERLRESFEDRFKLLGKLADALAIAHERIVHRDLKPSNIYLLRGDIGQPLILDFGLSVLDQDTVGMRSAGTPRYMAPEQFRGNADARSDLFALGIIAYELVTGGVHPFDGRNRELAACDGWPREDAEPPGRHCSLVPEALDRLILQLVRADREQRPASARDVLAALSAISLGATAETGVGRGETGPETVAIAPGSYLVGSAPGQGFPPERPIRRVAISGFRMATAPVSNAEYRRFVAATGRNPPDLADDPTFGRDDHPVVMVAWEDAAAYAAWIGGRLPSEIEWEIAAKAGLERCVYPWGEAALNAQYANHDGNVGATTPVHAYPLGRGANGLWDLVGNVWEWCADAWVADFYRGLGDGAVDPVADDPRPAERALRGGSFESFPNMCRCAFRHKAGAAEARADIGFRVVFDGTDA